MPAFLAYFKKFTLYTGASLIKMGIGLLILILTFSLLNVKEDPEVALSMLLIGIFVFARGAAYFLFYGGELLFLIKVSQEKMQKDAYKASFLFGLYALINVLLLIGSFWSKFVGILILLVFTALWGVLFTYKPQH